MREGERGKVREGEKEWVSKKEMEGMREGGRNE